MSRYIKEEDACVRLWKKLKGLSDVIPMGKDAAGVAVRIIEDLPIADVEPVRHGHWKVVNDSYGGKAYICECSECKDTVWVYKDSDRKWNYCPNCGARMDGERGKR
jgi:hypothetical protein